MKKILLFSGIGIILIALVIIFWGSIKRLFIPQNNQTVLTYLPFKEDKDDRWGLIDMNGNIIIANEWENEPSYAVEGIVKVKNKDGLYEFYTAEEKTKKIGDEYKTATLFYEGLAAVAKENSQIMYINKQGKTVFELKEADGKSVEAAGSFVEGMACFQTDNGRWGFVDKTGKVIIKPIYSYVQNFSEGIALVELTEYKDKDSIEQIIKRGFIDKYGKEIIKLKADILYSQMSDGLIPYSDNEGKEWGFLNIKGEKIIKPSKDFNRILPFVDGYASFFDGDKWGIINKKGEKIIRAKYDLTYYSNGLVIVGDKKKIGFINIDGEEVIKPEYELEVSIPFYGNTTVVKDGNKYILIDKKGKQVGKKDYAEIGGLDEFLMHVFGYGRGQELAYNDYFNIASVANAAVSSISKNRINNISGGMGVKEIITIIKALEKKYASNQPANNHGSISGRSNYSREEEREKAIQDSIRLADSIAKEYLARGMSPPSANVNNEFKGLSYSYNTIEIPYIRINNNASFRGSLSFDEIVASPIEVSRSNGWYSYKETVGYRLNPAAKLTGIYFSISLSGKGEGKGKLIAEDLKSKLEKAGFILNKENSSESQFAFMNNNKENIAMIRFDATSIEFSFRFEK